MNVRQNIISNRRNIASSPPLQADRRRRGGEPEVAPVLATESQNDDRRVSAKVEERPKFREQTGLIHFRVCVESDISR